MLRICVLRKQIDNEFYVYIFPAERWEEAARRIFLSACNPYLNMTFKDAEDLIHVVKQLKEEEL